MGVILDTSVFIDAERKRLPVDHLLKALLQRFPSEDFALTTVSVAEMEHGIWRATQPEHEQRRRKFLEELLEAVPAHPLTTEIVGRIDAECKKIGRAVGFQDLVIGATALEFAYSVLTLNLRHFEMIPTLKVELL